MSVATEGSTEVASRPDLQIAKPEARRVIRAPAAAADMLGVALRHQLGRSDRLLDWALACLSAEVRGETRVGESRGGWWLSAPRGSIRSLTSSRVG
jgi:hypothetical protein